MLASRGVGAWGSTEFAARKVAFSPVLKDTQGRGWRGRRCEPLPLQRRQDAPQWLWCPATSAVRRLLRAIRAAVRLIRSLPTAARERWHVRRRRAAKPTGCWVRTRPCGGSPARSNVPRKSSAPCSCRARRARARNCGRGSCIAAARGATRSSCPSTVRPSRRRSPRVNSSVTRRARLPVRPVVRSVSSARPKAAWCSSTRSGRCRRSCSRNCCACSSSEKCCLSAPRSRCRSTCRSSPRRTATSKPRSRRARSAKISTTA